MSTKKSEDCSPRLIYVRRLYDLVLNWYKNADTKAQAILTLDGAIITFLTGFMLLQPAEIQNTITALSPIDLAFLLLLALSLIASVGFALISFRSRLAKSETSDFRVYHNVIPPEKMWFFGDIANSDKKLFKQMIENVDEKFEITALSDQIHILSNNVLHKHLWVNRAFFAFGLSLVALILFLGSYILTLPKI